MDPTRRKILAARTAMAAAPRVFAEQTGAYGFPLVGAISALCIALLVSTAISTLRPAKAPTVNVETSHSFRLGQ
jgi:hypothetical protein